MKEISLHTTKRNELINITNDIASNITRDFEGIALVYVPHTTAAITINEGADPSVRSDILDRLEELVPAGAGYKHTEGNSDSHIKSSLIGNTVNLIVKNGRLVLGTWQAIFFCEFDGPRHRKVYLSLIEKA